jgi:hypothetical protein
MIWRNPSQNDHGRHVMQDQTMSAENFIDGLIKDSENPLNFLQYMKRYGSYRPSANLAELYNDLDLSGMPRNGSCSAFSCGGCNATIGLKPAISHASFDDNGDHWLGECDRIIDSLPPILKIRCLKRENGLFYVTLEEWLYQVHGLWRKPKLFFGFKIVAILTCAKCTTANVIEVDTPLYRQSTCKRVWSVPFNTINQVRNLIDGYLWAEPFQGKHHKVGEDFRGGRNLVIDIDFDNLSGK